MILDGKSDLKKKSHQSIQYNFRLYKVGTHGVLVTIMGNGDDNLSSNPGQSCLQFT